MKIDLSCLNYSHSRGRNGSLPGILLKGIDINYKSLLVLIKIISNNFLSRYPKIFFSDSSSSLDKLTKNERRIFKERAKEVSEQP